MELYLRWLFKLQQHPSHKSAIQQLTFSGGLAARPSTVGAVHDLTA